LANRRLNPPAPPPLLVGFWFIAGVDGELVLGLVASLAMCCCDASANIALLALRLPRSAGVSSFPHDSDPDSPQIPSVALSVFQVFRPCADLSSVSCVPSLAHPFKRFNDHFKAIGVINVVTITIITTAVKVPELNDWFARSS
jgi:hypothetical protein